MRRMIENNSPTKYYNTYDSLPFDNEIGCVVFNLHEGDSIEITSTAIEEIIAEEQQQNISITIDFNTLDSDGKTFIMGPLLYQKMTNAGLTFEDIFDGYSTISGYVSVNPDNWFRPETPGIKVCYRAGITYIDIATEY